MTIKAYNKAVDEYADGLFRFAFKHLKNEMLAKDIVQETYTKVWVKVEQINEEKIKSYLFTTAYHCILDQIKLDKKTVEINAKHDERTIQNPNYDLKEVINMALDRLPEIQKTVVMLRDYEGYAYDEIAEITSLSEAQVKVYIFRARQSLKNYIKALDLVI